MAQEYPTAQNFVLKANLEQIEELVYHLKVAGVDAKLNPKDDQADADHDGCQMISFRADQISIAQSIIEADFY